MDGCARLGMLHERIPVATPNKNAHIESRHSLLEAECWRNGLRRACGGLHGHHGVDGVLK